MRWPWQKAPEVKDNLFSDALTRLIAAQEGSLSGLVTPESCMQSPTVHAIVTAISRRISVTPVHVYRTGTERGRETKEKLADHPVSRLLRNPNKWQTATDFWQDAVSVYMRHGRFYAYKGRGITGPIRELYPLHPGRVDPKQDADTYAVEFHVSQGSGQQVVYTPDRLLHARGPARDFLKGDSPVSDVANTIAMEILAERFGVSFFQNGALPLLVLSFLEGSSGFREQAQEAEFIRSFQDMFGGDKKHTAMLLPSGMAPPTPIQVEHDKAQFIETRKFQRTVIAGAFGVPPTYVGDLERATFNNVEQQSQDFVLDCVLPVARVFEAAMERDLLTPADRSGGVVIRFNLDADLRADFKTRQEGLRIQRDAGVISANEWREMEGKNPIDDDKGGDDYMRPANMMVAGEEPENEIEPDNTAFGQEPDAEGV